MSEPDIESDFCKPQPPGPGFKASQIKDRFKWILRVLFVCLFVFFKRKHKYLPLICEDIFHSTIIQS